MSIPRFNVAPWVILGCYFFFVLIGCRSEPETGDGNDSQNATVQFHSVNFQDQANRSLADYEGIPGNKRQIRGVDFQIGPKILQVGSRVFPEFPPALPPIPVADNCSAIHFLHATHGGSYPNPNHEKYEADGVRVGSYKVTYEDGSTTSIPLIFGQQLRGWWDWDNNTMKISAAEMVWTGENPKAGQFNRKIRFFWYVWENPEPTKTIKTIQLLSANAKAAPFCLAMTLEKPR